MIFVLVYLVVEVFLVEDGSGLYDGVYIFLIPSPTEFLVIFKKGIEEMRVIAENF